MGNESSKLPAAIPQDKLEQIRNGDLTNEEIKRLIYEGFDESTGRKKHSRKKRIGQSDKKTQAANTDAAETTDQPQRDGKKKAAPFSRSKTLSDVSSRNAPKKMPLARCKTDGNRIDRSSNSLDVESTHSTKNISAEMTSKSRRRRRSRKDAPLKRSQTFSPDSDTMSFSLREPSSNGRLGDNSSSCHLDRNEPLSSSSHHVRRKRASLRKAISDDGSNRSPCKMDPQQVIQLLERYSSVDINMADMYFKSLQKKPHDGSSTNPVPKAA